MARWLHEVQESAVERRHEEAMGYADDLAQQVQCLRVQLTDLTNMIQRALLTRKAD